MTLSGNAPPRPTTDIPRDPPAQAVAKGRAVVTPSPAVEPKPRAAAANRRSWVRRAAVLGVLLVVFGVGAWFTLLKPVDVTLVPVRRGPAIEAAYATGVVEAIATAKVGSMVASRIVKLAVDEGATVNTGDELALLDDRQPRQRVADTIARLALAEQELARGEELAQRGIRSQQQLQRDIEARDIATAAVLLARRQLEEYRITAPLSGIVMKRPVEPGETIAVNTTMFEIASPRRLRVAADVDERDIAQVRMGARVAIRAEAFPDEVFIAAITNIRQQGESTTRIFRVEADLPAGTRLLIGMTVDVNIVIAERPDALLVAPTAIRYGPGVGGRPGPAAVFTAVEGHARLIPVTLGAVAANAVELRGGLDATAVIDPLPPALMDGARVHVRP